MAIRRTLAFILAALIAATLLAAIALSQALAGLPAIDNLPTQLNPPSVRIVDRQGRLLYEVLSESGGRHTVVPLEAIPLSLRQATIATEDKHFYTNPGVDFSGILRSAWINLQGGETLAGGSTITQQVARNLLMSGPERASRSPVRKLRESVLAWRLARALPKDQILTLYLNQMYYGGMAYGVEAAAQTYFGKPVAELDLAQSALLAGLPQAPALYNPYTDPQAAKDRQKIVLGLMESAGYITTEQRQLAEREPLGLAALPYPMRAPHFVMMVRAQLDQLFSPEQIYQHGGLTVRTSLNLDWQTLAEAAIARQLDNLKSSDDSLGHNVNNAALVALDPHSGEIMALVGSPDFFDSTRGGAINMALAVRQPGSALKPIVYAAALDPARAQPWTAATMLLDVKTSFVTHDGQAYIPANYDGLEHGPVLVREALASSLNIPAVLTLQHVGLSTLSKLAGRMGLATLADASRLEHYDLSLALGGGEVRLLDLTSAYATFANGGLRVTPLTILEITDSQGALLYTAPPPDKERVLDARLAWLISDILSDNNARILGFGRNSILRLDRPAAVKTGTTTNFHDNWTVGYTPELVVGVWAGNTDYAAMRDVTGLTGAAPIWHQFMRAALSGRPAQGFTRPEGLVAVEICKLSGLLPTPACPYRQVEWFIDGTQPTQEDYFYQQVSVDAATGQLADNATPPERRRLLVALDLPLQAQPWGHAQKLTLLSDLQAADLSQQAVPGALQAAGGEQPLGMISPADGAVYRLAPGFPSQAQQIRLEAVGQAGLGQVSLWIDGEQVAVFSAAPYQAWWPLSAGNHQAWAEAVGQNGERVASQRVRFEVEEK